MDSPTQVVRHIPQNHSGWRDVILSPDDRRLIEVNTQAAEVWDLRPGTLLSSYDITPLRLSWYADYYLSDSYRAGVHVRDAHNTASIYTGEAVAIRMPG